MTRSPWQASTWRLRHVSGAKFLRVEISIGRNQFEFIEWPRPQLAFDTLRSRFSQVQRFEETIEADQIRQVVMKIGRANRDLLCPKTLFDTGVPTETFFRLQRRQWLTGIWIKSEDFILTARRTKPFGDACV